MQSKIIFTWIFLSVCNLAFGQKYMIIKKDTLPFKATMVITNDTTHNGKTIYIKRDTSYEDPCNVFEKINGKIVNRTDSSCLQQGLWISTDSVGNYSTSFYIDGDDSGKWKNFSKSGRLLKETEEVSLGKEFYVVKEIDYSSGHPVTIVNVPFFGFYINHFDVILPILVLLSSVRILINYKIYNIENNTNYPSFRNHFKFKLFEPGELRYRLISIFTLWFFKYKPENRYSAIISNILSIFCFGSYAIFLIGPALCR